MAKVKSTLDLIMEKTKHLSLNEEEKAAFERRQLSQRVQAPLLRYLKGERDANYLAHELDLLPPDSIEEAKGLALDLLTERLSPLEDNRRVFAAVEKLLGKAGRDSWEKIFAPLHSRFLDDQREIREKAADRCRQSLAAAGLKGPSLLPHVNEQDPAWKQEQEALVQAFCASLKKALRDAQM